VIVAGRREGGAAPVPPMATRPLRSLAFAASVVVALAVAGCGTSQPPANAKALAAKACSAVSSASTSSLAAETAGLEAAIVPATQAAAIDPHWKPLVRAIATDRRMLAVIAGVVGASSSPHPKQLSTEQTVAAGLALKRAGITESQVTAADADGKRLCNEAQKAR